MSTLKYSRQREAIKTFLMNRTDHPTADTIYTSLRREYPNISLGTVYRNLSLLVDLGDISRISTGATAEHYDANMTPHQHFICTKCDKVYDVQIDDINTLVQAASRICPGRINSCRTHFYGICEECLEDSE